MEGGGREGGRRERGGEGGREGGREGEREREEFSCDREPENPGPSLILTCPIL